jgi:enoyl-[acyl-carrier protein] reductase I
LEGRRVVVLGVADESSIAWGVATAFARAGALVTVGFQQRFFSRVRLLLREWPGIEGERCDVLSEEELEGFFSRFDGCGLDVVVHAVAFGPPEVFTSPPSEVSGEAFAETLLVSAHSLGRVVRFAGPRLREWGSVVTFTFQASERAVPSYGLMGVAKSALEGMVRYLALELGPRRIRVNAVSPGPIETVAAVGIALAFVRDREAVARSRDRVLQAAVCAVPAGELDLDGAAGVWRAVQDSQVRGCPIPEAVTKEDVAGCALFLGSDLSRLITGQVIHVDAGMSAAVVR